MVGIQSCRLMEVSSQDKLDFQAVACLLININAVIVFVVRGKDCDRDFRLEPVWVFGELGVVCSVNRTQLLQIQRF